MSALHRRRPSPGSRLGQAISCRWSARRRDRLAEALGVPRREIDDAHLAALGKASRPAWPQARAIPRRSLRRYARSGRSGGAHSRLRETLRRVPAQIGDDRRIAVERVCRIARVAQRLEPHRAGVHHHQPSDQALAEADDFADRLQRHHRAHMPASAPMTPASAQAGTVRAAAARGQAAIGRLELALSLRSWRGSWSAIRRIAERRRDQRLAGKEAGIGNQITRFEIIGAVEHEIAAISDITFLHRDAPHAPRNEHAD